MKKLIVGAALFMTGIISAVVLLACTMGNSFYNLSQFAGTMHVLELYGLVQIFYIMLGLALAGIVISIWGLIEKKQK